MNAKPKKKKKEAVPKMEEPKVEIENHQMDVEIETDDNKMDIDNKPSMTAKRKP